MNSKRNITIDLGGPAGLMAVIFICLKITGNITWSWLWVLAPIWISAGFAAMVFLFVGICFIAAGIFAKGRIKVKRY